MSRETKHETLKVEELPQEMRPREELARRGAASVANEILMAIILRTGLPGQNVIEVARALQVRSGGLEQLAKLSYREIMALKVAGVGKVKAMELAAAFELGRRAANYKPRDEATLVNDARIVYGLLADKAHLMVVETFWVLLLNAKNRLIGHPIAISCGTADSSPANPREILRPAISHNAVSLIVAHNHPSGDPTPSSADLRVTRQLVEAARIMGLRLLDHVILGQPRPGNPGYFSIRQQGLVQFE